jgi:hypothetical protein
MFSSGMFLNLAHPIHCVICAKIVSTLSKNGMRKIKNEMAEGKQIPQ